MMEAEQVDLIGNGKELYAAALHGVSEGQTAGMLTKGDGTTQVLSAANTPFPRQEHCAMLVLPVDAVVDHCGQLTHTVAIAAAANTP